MSDKKVINLELLTLYDNKLKEYINEEIKEVENKIGENISEQSTISLPYFGDPTV